MDFKHEFNYKFPQSNIIYDHCQRIFIGLLVSVISFSCRSNQVAVNQVDSQLTNNQNDRISRPNTSKILIQMNNYQTTVQETAHELEMILGKYSRKTETFSAHPTPSHDINVILSANYNGHFYVEIQEIKDGVMVGPYIFVGYKLPKFQVLAINNQKIYGTKAVDLETFNVIPQDKSASKEWVDPQDISVALFLLRESQQVFNQEHVYEVNEKSTLIKNNYLAFSNALISYFTIVKNYQCYLQASKNLSSVFSSK